MSNYHLTLLASGTRTTDGQGPDFRIPEGRSGQIVLDVSAKGGTTPTLDVDVMVKDPISGNYVLLKSFTQVGDATGTSRLGIGGGNDDTTLPREGRIEWAIAGGGGETYTFSVGATING